MKKLILAAILVAVLVGVSVLAAGCNNSATPYASWADEETLTYQITDTNTKAVKGTLTVKTERSISTAKKTLNGKEYPSADGIVTMEMEITGAYTQTTVFLTKGYSVLATQKTYVDETDATKNFVLNAYHSGNYYYYDKNGAKGEIKVGSTCTDSEYIYHYIRAYSLSSPPSNVSIADPNDGSVKKVGCSAYASTTIDVPYPGGNKAVNCTVIAITLTEKPQGQSIFVAYTPDSKDYELKGLSINASRKIPVQIIENNVTYTVTSMAVK